MFMIDDLAQLTCARRCRAWFIVSGRTDVPATAFPAHQYSVSILSRLRYPDLNSQKEPVENP